MRWGQPIDLVSEDYQVRLTITTTTAALQWLRERRSVPARRRLHLAAIGACLAESDGKTARARALFIRAARAAGFLVQTAHWYESNAPLPSLTEMQPEDLPHVMTACKQSLSKQKR